VWLARVELPLLLVTLSGVRYSWLSGNPGLFIFFWLNPLSLTAFGRSQPASNWHQSKVQFLEFSSCQEVNRSS
jgi:hypothetical protein